MTLALTYSSDAEVDSISTFRKQLQKLNWPLDQLLEIFFEGTTDAIFMKDLEGKYLLINSAGANFLNSTPAEIIGKTDYYFFDQKSAFRIREDDRHVIQLNKICTYEKVSYIGSKKKIFFSTKGPFRDQLGKIKGTIGISRDVTDRKVAEEDLIRVTHQLELLTLQNQKLDLKTDLTHIFRTLISSSLQIVPTRVATYGMINKYENGSPDSPAQQDTMVFTEYYAHGKTHPFFSTFKAGEAIPGWVLENRRTFRTEGRETRHHALSKIPGFHTPQTLLNIPIIACDGTIFGCIELHDKRDGTEFSISDITKLTHIASTAAVAIQNAHMFVKLRTAEREAQASIQIRDEFVSIAAHELRTPITTLNLGLSVMKRQINHQGLSSLSEDKFNRLLDLACAQTQRLNDMIGNLLDVSRIRTGRLEIQRQKMELNDLIQGVLKNLSEPILTSNCTVTFTSPQSEIFGIWDRLRLEQVIINLIANALKYAAGSTIEIRLAIFELFVEIQIQDHGPGIEISIQDKIFERFERGVSSDHFGGLGLGLYISRQIITAHQGSIVLNSEPGQGAKFTIQLPFTG